MIAFVPLPHQKFIELNILPVLYIHQNIRMFRRCVLQKFGVGAGIGIGVEFGEAKCRP